MMMCGLLMVRQFGDIMTIEIVNLHFEKPSEPYEVKVDRSSPLGNPFYMFDESWRDIVCDQYEEYLSDSTTKKHKEICNELNKLFLLYVKYGKLRLFCWCAPRRCHAETIRSTLLDWDSL
jgi:hypothetical protein